MRDGPVVPLLEPHCRKPCVCIPSEEGVAGITSVGAHYTAAGAPGWSGTGTAAAGEEGRASHGSVGGRAVVRTSVAVRGQRRPLLLLLEHGDAWTQPRRTSQPHHSLQLSAARAAYASDPPRAPTVMNSELVARGHLLWRAVHPRRCVRTPLRALQHEDRIVHRLQCAERFQGGCAARVGGDG